MWKVWGIYILLLPIGLFLSHINTQNYQVHREILDTIVEHPSLLPSSQSAKFASFGYTNFMADMYWLKTIQYIGENSISGEYKKFLSTILNLITDLNPYFEKPYIIGELLLPSYNEQYENLSDSEVQTHIYEAEALGIKGMQNFCDMQKVTNIMNEYDLGKIIQDPMYHNPCKSYQIPYYLAYIYFYYQKDTLTASKYYKVVAAQEDAPAGAKILAAIMQGRGGDREKSLFMFLSLGNSLGSEQDGCTQMIQKLEATLLYLTETQTPLSGEVLQSINTDLAEILPSLTQENEDTVLADTTCTNYLAKAVRELNLLYLSQAQQTYLTQHPDASPLTTPQELYDAGYISYVPTDYQQYEDLEYGIRYLYDEEIGDFDYAMGYE